MADRGNGRAVFVGNIPYDTTEEVITETLSRVGQVVSFRLVYDKDTGKPKGFGFAEYADSDAAASAVRNLNDYELMGRHLRVDYSNDAGDGAQDAGPNGRLAAAAAAAAAAATGPVTTEIRTKTLPANFQQLPPGAAVPAEVSSIDVISQTLRQIKLPQLLDIVRDVKALVHKDPVRAAELFRQSPQLAYALFQSLLLMGLVDARELTAILANQPGQQPVAPAVPSVSATATVNVVATPPVAAAAPAIPGGPAGAQQPTQQNLIDQLLALKPHQIQQLPEESRAQIEALRRQYGTR